MEIKSKTFVRSTHGGYEFFLPSRYKPIELIGVGSYGAVIEALDNKTHISVAIKKIQNIMDEVDLKRVIREIMILKYMKHDNIIGLYDVIFVRSFDKKKIGDVYLVFEKMGTDLYKIIKSNQDLSEEHYKFIFYQICRAILYLHSANIIHRDIKPSNVLINEDCIIKLCDFGLSRNLRDGEQLSLTEYVVTRYYRAPEVMLCSHQYSKSVDIWSIGCTFAEMLSKNYLFPGDNYLTQIKLFIEVLGSPQEEDIEFITNGHAKNYVLNFKNIPKKNMAEIVNCDDSNAVDLLEKMLVFNPGKRITIDEIMKHPYTSSIKESGVVDPLYTGNINFDFDYDAKITKEDLIIQLENEIKDFDTGLIQ